MSLYSFSFEVASSGLNGKSERPLTSPQNVLNPNSTVLLSAPSSVAGSDSVFGAAPVGAVCCAAVEAIGNRVNIAISNRYVMYFIVVIPQRRKKFPDG
jgi:hypothetical protein